MQTQNLFQVFSEVFIESQHAFNKCEIESSLFFILGIIPNIPIDPLEYLAISYKEVILSCKRYLNIYLPFSCFLISLMSVCLPGCQ